MRARNGMGIAPRAGSPDARVILKTLALNGVLCHTAFMANNGDIELEHKPTETLRQNKRKMGASKAKFDDVRSGNEPGLVSPTKQAREGAAKTSKAYRGASGRQTDFELIMGKTPAFKKGKQVYGDNIARHQEKKGRSDNQPSTLHIPIVRPERLATEDGRTSFHFSHDSVAKTRNATVNETTGRVNRPGAAKAHNKYIERDSAVAIDEEGMPAPANDTGIEAENGVDPLSPVNDNDGTAVESKEPYFDRPLSRSFLRTYRATLGALLADPDPDPRGGPPGEIHGLRDMPGGDLVHDNRTAEMLVFANEVPVVGRDRATGAGMRRAGDGNPEGRGGGDGRLTIAPVPARLSRPPVKDNRLAIAALSGEPANDPRTPDGQGRYIERQEALAIQPDGKRVLYTNIDNDADKRAEFWRLVEEHEYDPSPDKISFTMADNPGYWAKVAADPKCPPKIAEALGAADPTKKLSVETDDNVAVRKFLMSVEGWPDTGPRKREETAQECKSRLAEAPCKFHDGRGGRVQYRIIGELPHELSTKGRASLLKTFSKEFEDRKLPYVAVMHAPDHTNNDKNWHFHLVYYDRPCARVTPEQITEYVANKGRPSDPMLPGNWDFTVKDREHDKKNWNNRVTYPFAQEKVKEVTRTQDWIETLRKRLSEITNDHLEEAGVARRVDPRRHSEMGIHNDPQEHLGTKLAQLEAMGIATPKGTSNEERQWAAMQVRLDGDLTRRKSMVDQQARKWLQQAARASHLDDDAKLQLRGNVTRWHQHQTEAEEHQGIAENLDQHMSRMTSRAEKVKETCLKHLEAIDGGSASKFQASRITQLQGKANEAMEFLQMATKMLTDEVKLSADCKGNAAREQLIADQLKLTIERALLAGGVKQAIAEERKRTVDDEDRKKRVRRDEQQVEAEVEQVKRRALVREQMDTWVAGIRAGRRLIMQDRRIVPMDMNDEDRSIVDAINYGAMQGRLAGIKKNQDALVADVVKAVLDQPENVVRQRTAKGETHVLVTSNRTQAKAFRDWAADPAIADAREKALARNADDAARRVAERAVDQAGRTTAPSAGDAVEGVRPDVTVAPAARDQKARPAGEDRTPVVETDRPTVQAERTPVESARRDGVERDAVSNDRRSQVASRQALNERIVRAVREEARKVNVVDGVATLADRHLRAIGVEATDLVDGALQKRLVGLAGVQDREIKRVTAYARSHPDRLVERDGLMAVGARAPREIVEMSTRWRGDESVDLALRAIREAAVPSTPRETARTPKPAPERAPVRADESTQRTPVERTTVDDTQRTPAERTPSMSVERPTANPSDKTAGTRTDDARQDRPPVEAGPSRAATVPPAEERPRFTDLTPDYELREQARAYALEQERARQQAAEREAAPAVAPVARADEDPVSRAVRLASQKAATSGAHPLIDEWMQGVRDGIPVEERRTMALRVTTERSSREKLREIDRTVARRIREDAENARAAQQPGLGLGLDLGPAPRR